MPCEVRKPSAGRVVNSLTGIDEHPSFVYHYLSVAQIKVRPVYFSYHHRFISFHQHVKRVSRPSLNKTFVNYTDVQKCTLNKTRCGLNCLSNGTTLIIILAANTILHGSKYESFSYIFLHILITWNLFQDISYFWSYFCSNITFRYAPGVT